MTALSPAPPSPPSPLLSANSRVLFKPLEGAATGGCHAEIYLPKMGAVGPSKVGKKGWPVALFIHGGAFIAGGCYDISLPQVQYLVSKGIVCVSIEYRLAPHADLAAQSEDCLSAFEWIRDGGMAKALKEEGKLDDGDEIDSERIVGVGYSAGGYLVNMLGHQASPPLAAILSFYSINDLELIAVTPKDATYLGCSPSEIAFANKVFEGGAVTDDRDDFVKNPINPRSTWMRLVMIASTVISHNYPPIFLAIPQLDTLVPPSQSWRFAERLKEVGVEVETARAEGAGHAFDLHGGPRTEEGGDWWEGVIRKGLDFLVGKLR
ncbi:Alpha/Beta hydrolase protein [Mrakia frigida]|uniref:alpha/beta hydrolase n=1 Tax=Mrakia frigida TaxID=29902 RepID=UPI003FCC033B